MAFQLTANESVGDGVKRNVAKELDKALATLHTPKDEHATVHDARKSLKKVRAALRLIRDELGDEIYRRENYALRDAARPLTEVRDADVLLEVLDDLRARFPKELTPTAVATLHEVLLAQRRSIDARVLRQRQALARVARAIEAARARLDVDWTIRADGWPAIARGLRRVYRAGYHQLSAAATDASVETLHEWRKQAKYLWHALQLLELAWSGAEPTLADRFHALSTTLGHDHDLAVLRGIVERHGPLGVVQLIDRRRGELQREAFVLGRQLYAERPTVFAGRIERHFAAWRAALADAPATSFRRGKSDAPSGRRPRLAGRGG